MKLLNTIRVEKPWGKFELPEPFSSDGQGKIGEIWFDPPAELSDLLVKFIFTSEQLSIQVHPDDTQAVRLEGSRAGKEECWLVLDAQPGAKLGIGFSKQSNATDVRSGAENGTIESLMDWFEVRSGDYFYIPAGTVHAIGAGIALVEIQQNSDITYRLYDYGRPRELHLDKGMAVATFGPHDPKLRQRDVFGNSRQLCDGPHFKLWCVSTTSSLSERAEKRCLIIAIKGDLQVSGQLVGQGCCALVEAGDIVSLSDGGIFLRAESLGAQSIDG